MTRYRNHKEVYNRDFSRWSVYPRMPRPKEYRPSTPLSRGDVVEAEIVSVDEDGQKIARYGRYKIIVKGNATVGDRVNVRVLMVSGNEAVGELIR